MSVPHCPPFWTEGSIKSRRGVPYLYQAVPVFFVLLCYTTQTKSASKSQSTAERSQGGNSRQEPEGGTACHLMQHYLQPGNSLTAKEGQQEPWAVLPGVLTFFFFLYKSRTTLLGLVPSTLELPISVYNKDNLSQLCPQTA